MHAPSHVAWWVCRCSGGLSFPAHVLTLPILACFSGPLSCALIMEWCDMGKPPVLLRLCRSLCAAPFVLPLMCVLAQRLATCITGATLQSLAAAIMDGRSEVLTAFLLRSIPHRSAGSLADAIDSGAFARYAKAAAAALAQPPAKGSSRGFLSAASVRTDRASLVAAASHSANANAIGAAGATQEGGGAGGGGGGAAALAGTAAMRAVYLTLLEVALALRHLHGEDACSWPRACTFACMQPDIQNANIASSVDSCASLRCASVRAPTALLPQLAAFRALSSADNAFAPAFNPPAPAPHGPPQLSSWCTATSRWANTSPRALVKW